MILGIDVVYLHTSNIEGLKAWYQEKLGLETVYGDGHWEELGMAVGSRFALDAVSPDTPAPVEQQPVMLSFRVDDIHEAVRVMAERGVEFYPDVEQTVFQAGPALVATFKDGAGHWMQLSMPAAEHGDPT